MILGNEVRIYVKRLRADSWEQNSDLAIWNKVGIDSRDQDWD